MAGGRRLAAGAGAAEPADDQAKGASNQAELGALAAVAADLHNG